MRPPLLIACGLAVVAAAQFFDGVPIATAIAVVAWGATLSALQRRSSSAALLAVVSVAVYAPLVVLTIASQTAAMRYSLQNQLPTQFLFDHAAALVATFALARHAIGAFLESTEDAQHGP